MIRAKVQYVLMPISAAQMKEIVILGERDLRAFPIFWSPEICFSPPDKFSDDLPWYWPPIAGKGEIVVSDDLRTAWFER